MSEQESTLDFAKPYRLGSEAVLGLKIWLGKGKLEEVNEFKYLGTKGYISKRVDR